LGAALRYTVQAHEASTGQSVTIRCYVKVYRASHGEKEFLLLQSLSERAGARQKLYSVIKPIVYLNGLRTLVVEEAPGASLQELLPGSRDQAALVRAVARAVAAFNQDDLDITNRHSLADQLEDVKRAASIVEWACPQMRTEIQTIATAVVEGLEEVPPASIHRDLKPDHIFLVGDRVMFIDLDASSLGDPVRDPAHLFAHLVARVGLDALSPEQARSAATVFANEYFAHVPTPWRKQFPLHCAGALIEVAGSIFKRQEPHWREKVTEAVTAAQHILSDGFM
jgi:Ser/Thr protein kinase RdoA (MazF antagonist)